MSKKIVIPPLDREYLDESTSTFITFNGATLKIEHSLVSISKWEAKYKRPFFSNDPKTAEEIFDYIRMMTLNHVDDTAYQFLTQKNIDEITDYIQDSMTATTITEHNPSRSQRVITSEVIYCAMIQCGIPYKCRKWHINRLMTLIKVCQVESGGEKKMSRTEAGAYQRALSEKRMAAAKRR